MALEVTSLLKNLDSTLRVIKQLLDLSRTEQKAIINNRVQELVTINEHKNQLLDSINNLNKTKEKLLAQFVKEQKINKKITAIEDVLAFLPSEIMITAKKYIIAIKRMLMELKAINDNSGKLINYNLSFINYLVNNLTSPEEQKCTYTSNGIYKKSLRKGYLEYSF